MYLKQLKLVTSAARPSLPNVSAHTATSSTCHPTTQPGESYRMTVGTQRVSNTLDVKGAATEASASEREIPISAAFRAPQSLAPSPQNPQQ